MVKVNEKCKEHDMNDLYCHLICIFSTCKPWSKHAKQ